MLNHILYTSDRKYFLFFHLNFIFLNSVEVLATLTSDVGRILSKLHQVQPNGNLCLITGIRIAHVSILIILMLCYTKFIIVMSVNKNKSTVGTETSSR